MSKGFPIQPVQKDKLGTLRFVPNRIVEKIIEDGFVDLNQIARWGFSREEHEQFAQLIGYSVSCFSELSYARRETWETAYAMAEGMDPKDAKIQALEATLAATKTAIKSAAVALFDIHPDDLEEGEDES